MFMRTLIKPLALGAFLLVGQGCQFMCHVARNVVHEPLLACDEKSTKHRCRKLGKQAWNEMVHQYGESFSCDYRQGFVDGFADYLYYGGCIGGSQQSGCAGGSCAAGGALATGVTAGAGVAVVAGATDGVGAALVAGGTGAAGAAGCGAIVEAPICPPVPPNQYRRKRYMTPEGVAAVEDWYAGFRHGAATAMASGLRNLVVIPVQCPPKFGPDDGFQPEVSTRPRVGPGGKEQVPVMPPPEEIIPPSTDVLPPPRPDAGASPAVPAVPPPAPGS
jgi:hypothetical protein